MDLTALSFIDANPAVVAEDEGFALKATEQFKLFKQDKETTSIPLCNSQKPGKCCINSV